MNSRLFAIPLWPACSSSPPAVAKEERMGWNSGLMKLKFEQQEKEMKRICREAGMDEEIIERLYEEDLKAFNGDRRFYEHTQQLEIPTEDIGEVETRNPLYKKFLEAVTEMPEESSKPKYWWMDQIENKRLYFAVRRLSEKKKQIIESIVIDGNSMAETAEMLGLSYTTVRGYYYETIEFLAEALKK